MSETSWRRRSHRVKRFRWQKCIRSKQKRRLPDRTRTGSQTTVNQIGTPAPPTAKLLAGPVVDLTKYEDVRQPLMDWLRSPENPLFANAFVNRVWANYFNVGIVQPSDDMNLANPPVNAPCWIILPKGFIEQKFDMKWLHREILNSRTYQLSWIPNSTNRLDERNFSRAVPRRFRPKLPTI